MNKKIINASETIFLDIKFKSALEARVYRALLEEDITPKYEEVTFTLSPKVRPTVPFYIGRTGKRFVYDMAPLRPITYTPDFTFMLNDIFVIIEVKGFENDIFPVKRNLFRKYLETPEAPHPAVYFEVKSKKELLEALTIVRMETPTISRIRSLIPVLPEKDIPIANKLFEKRDWEELQNLVSSAIIRVEKAMGKSTKYADIDINLLYTLQAAIPQPL